MGNVQQPIVGILVASDTIRREVVVVNPDIGRVLKLYQVLLAGGDVQVQVPQDHVVRFLDTNTSIGQAYKGFISILTLAQTLETV